MDIGKRAERVKAIMTDPVFEQLMAEVKSDQVAIFLAPDSTEDQIAEARLLIRAMEHLTDRMQRVLHDARMAERKTKKRP